MPNNEDLVLQCLEDLFTTLGTSVTSLEQRPILVLHLSECRLENSAFLVFNDRNSLLLIPVLNAILDLVQISNFV